MQCPDCGGPMWDNRETKKKPTQPDFKCKNRACDKAVWLDKKGSKGAEPSDPLDSVSPPYQQGAPPAPASPEARRLFLERHKKCFEYVIANYLPLVPEDVNVDLHGISALTFQILKGQEEAR
jgi:hypothetical protein